MLLVDADQISSGTPGLGSSTLASGSSFIRSSCIDIQEGKNKIAPREEMKNKDFFFDIDINNLESSIS